MINNGTMYDLYRETLTDKGKAILESCIIPLGEEELMKELLEDIKIFHTEYKDIKSIMDFTDIQIEQLRVSKPQKLFIISYINSVKTIKENKVKAREAMKIRVRSEEFSFILTTFNRLLWQAMIEKAYVFKHHLIGKLYVICRENAICKPKMKWKESKANKNAIIERGGLPKIELDARRAKYNKEDYKGEEWIERHDPFNLVIKWKRSAYANLKLPSIKDFNMQLVRTGVGNGVVNKLKDVRDNNKLEELLIKYQRNE